MNVSDIKKNNRKKIYAYIRENNLATKQDIAYNLKLSLPTITQHLDYLVSYGLIGSDVKISNKSGGRNPIGYSYIGGAKLAIGLDITRNHIKGVLIDLNGNIIKSIYKREVYERTDAYFKLLGKEVKETLEEVDVDLDKIIGVGIAMPGMMDQEGKVVIDGRVIDNENLTIEKCAKYIPYPSKFIHDSDASGFSEIWMSKELKEIKDIFYISLCNSIGGTFFLDQNIYFGNGLYTGEVGHLNVKHNGKLCYCGQRGCLDPHCNAEVLSDYTDGDLELFFTKLGQGDEKLQKVWDEYLDYLTIGITSIRMLFGCSVIIGGYVGAYMTNYMGVIQEKIDKKSPFQEKSITYLIQGRNNTESVATGAALRFVEEFLEG